MPYTFIEGITLADIAFEAWGRDLEEPSGQPLMPP